MDKIREEFELWLNTKFNPILRIEESGNYISPYVQIRWDAWQASRRAIVITAPPFVTSRAALERGYTVDYSSGHGDAMDAYELVLKEAGITIKGEE